MQSKRVFFRGSVEGDYLDLPSPHTIPEANDGLVWDSQALKMQKRQAYLSGVNGRERSLRSIKGYQ